MGASSRFGHAVWLFPVVFAAHVLEEAPGFTAWAKRHASRRYTQTDFIRNNGATVAYREYSPGLVTAIGGFLPLWWHLTLLARHEDLLTRDGALAAVAIGGAIHATAVAKQVYRR
jgi:hypothetical protein